MKLGKLLQRRLGRKDPPEEKIDVIIRFKRNITRADVSSLQNMGIQITGSSQRLPIVYGRATRNQIKKTGADAPSQKDRTCSSCKKLYKNHIKRTLDKYE